MRGLLDLFTILYDPPAVFARVKEKPHVLLPMVGLAALQIVVGILVLPYSREVMRAMTQAGSSSADLSRFAIIGVITAPIGLLVAVVFNAGILWVMVNLLGAEASFRHLLSVVSYVSITAIVAGFATIAVLALSGAHPTTMADLRPGFGLDLFAPDATGAVKGLLSAVNVFAIWALILTGLGVAATHKLSKGAAYAAATVVLIVNAALSAVFSLIGAARGA